MRLLPSIQTSVLGLTLLMLVHQSLAAPQNPEIQRILNNDPDDQLRLKAFNQLEEMGAIDAKQVLRSITDVSPQLRATALRAGTSLVAADPELEIRLLALSNDRSSQVRLQLLHCLPAFRHPKGPVIFLQLVNEEIENQNAWPVALAAKKDNLWPFLSDLIATKPWTKQTPAQVRFLEFSANTIRQANNPSALNSLLTFVADDSNLAQRWIRLALLRGTLRGFPQQKNAPLGKPLLLEATPPSVRQLQMSKDPEIRKLLSTSSPLLIWPETP